MTFKKGRVPWNKGLSKENSESVASMAAKKMGSRSPEIGAAISKALRYRRESLGLSAVRYEVCVGCERPKARNHNPICGSCAQKKRAAEWPNNMKAGMLKSNPEWFEKLLSTPKSRGKTKIEKKVEEAIHRLFGSENPFIFSGSGKSSVFLTISETRYRIPDFIDRQNRRVIEVFGSYWHPEIDEKETISDYESVGWRCLVIWDHQVEKAEALIKSWLAA